MSGIIADNAGRSSGLVKASASDFSSLTDTTVYASDPAGTSNVSATGHIWINKTIAAC